MAWHAAADLDEVSEGAPKIVSVAGKEIGLFFEGGRHSAVLNFCPHSGAPVCAGKVMGCVVVRENGSLDYDARRKVLRCPWHRWEFDLWSGEPVVPMRQRLRTYPVKVEAGQIWVDV